MPNAQVEYRPDAEYIREMVASIPLTQREIARRVGVSDRYIRALVAGTRTCNYPVQYCLECLSRGLNAEGSRGKSDEDVRHHQQNDPSCPGSHIERSSIA